jgi:hypothetical protein
VDNHRFGEEVMCVGPSQRIVTHLPLRDLWDDNGPLPAAWVRDLSPAQMRELLRVGPIRFVVAKIGAKPRWVAVADCFDFWKREVLPHLAGPEQRVSLEQFPGGYCYFAAEWECGGGPPIVVLQKCH